MILESPLSVDYINIIFLEFNETEMAVFKP